jgi:CheY-like chemotaxis protein
VFARACPTDWLSRSSDELSCEQERRDQCVGSASATQLQNMSPSIDGRPACLLIVDDNRENRELLAVVLTWEGFVCVAAASGEEALATAAREPPDLILLDAMMPGMDGYEVTARLKGDSATKNIPIIMVTAIADYNAKERARSAGAEDFLAKPINRDVLVPRLHRLLRETYADYHDK